MASIIDLSEPRILPLNAVSELSARDLRLLERVARIESVPGRGLRLTAKSRFAGRASLASLDLWIPPSCGVYEFAMMSLIHHGVSPEALSRVPLVATSPVGSLPGIEPLLAQYLVSQVEEIRKSHVAQGYEHRTERRQVLHGRPVWSSPLMMQPPGSILTRFFEKTTDTLPNMLLVAGLDRAERVLRYSGAANEARRQLATWSGLAQPQSASWRDFDLALDKLDRRTGHYRDALLAARSLIFGVSDSHREHDIPGAFTDLAILFESLCKALLRVALTRTELVVVAQVRDREAFRTADGRKYLEPRTDLEVRRSDEVLTVIDAKYKPNYCEYGPGLQESNRISSSDLFQMAVYGMSRIPAGRQRHVFIVAPQLGEGLLPSRLNREINFEYGSMMPVQITLVPLPVRDAVRAVATSDNELAQRLFQPILDHVRS